MFLACDNAREAGAARHENLRDGPKLLPLGLPLKGRASLRDATALCFAKMPERPLHEEEHEDNCQRGEGCPAEGSMSGRSVIRRQNLRSQKDVVSSAVALKEVAQFEAEERVTRNVKVVFT